jgi:hypothetical protein
MKRFFFAALVALVGPVAQAVTPPPPPPARLESIEVKPAVALKGVSRTITIKGTWPDACVPGVAAVDAPYNERLRQVFVRIVALADSGQFCAAVFTPYTIEVPYTPQFAGVDKVLVTIQSGTLQGDLIASREDRLFTGDPKIVRAADDISGLWYDPASNGSGLTLTHSFGGSDIVFGTWYVYDRAGFARWYTLQDAVWKTDTSLEGVVYETRGPGCQTAAACPNLVTAPPSFVGTFKMTFSNLRFADQQAGAARFAPTALVEVKSPSGVLAFSARISRLPL